MAFAAPALGFLFTSQSLIASTARFVAFSLISSALNRQTTEGPRLDDLTVQQSAYGVNIPLAYGAVRMAGNVIDASEIVETKNVNRKKKLGIITVAKNTTYTYSVTLAIMLAEGPLSTTSTIGRIWANGELIFDATSNNSSASSGDDTGDILTFDRGKNTHAFMTAMRFYRGTSTQTPDTALEAAHGVGNVPAYHGVAYCVLESLELQEFGNQVPSLEFELIDSVDPTVETIVADIAGRIGVSVYAGKVRGDTCKGYAVTQAGHAWSAIEPLAGAYSFDLVVDRGVVSAVKRAEKVRAHIPTEDLQGKGAGEPVQTRLDLKRADVLGLPKEVSVSYRDASRDYQTNAQRAFRDEGSADNNVSVELPITLTSDEARAVADRMLWEAWAASRRVEFSVSRQWEKLQATDIVTVDIGSERRAFRLERVTQGRNGVVQLEGTFEDPLLYASTAPGDSSQFTSPTIKLPGTATIYPFDAAINDDADDDAGQYFVVAAPNAGWLGGTVQSSEDSGVSYDDELDVFVDGTVALVLGTLGDASNLFFDMTNEIIVTAVGEDDTFVTVSDDDIFRGENLAWVGNADGSFGEYIQFATVAVQGSPMTFHLTRLRRGLFGTEYAIDQHSTGEVLILIDGAVNRSDDASSDWNVSRRFRCVSFYTEAADAPTVDNTNTGEGKRPLSPVQLRGHRNAVNDDIELTWIRRTRLTVPIVGPAPLGEDEEKYEVDVFNGTGGGASVIRTETVTTATFTYTEAMQTADGHTLGDPVKVRVYQISGVRGRGRHREGIV